MRSSPYFQESVLRCIAYSTFGDILSVTSVTERVTNPQGPRRRTTELSRLDGESSLNPSMSIELFFTDHPLYLEIHVEGKFSPASFDDAISLIHSEALARGTTRILCNCRKLSTDNMSPESSILSAGFARLWKSNIRIAIVTSRRSRERLFEYSDVESWANVSIFSNVRSAPKWLLRE